RDLRLNVAVNSRSDAVANVLLMMPVGCCAAGALWTRRPARRALPAILGISACGAILSLSMEFLQSFLPDRVVSLRDVISETFGSCVGAVAFLWLGPALTGALRRRAGDREDASLAERWLLAYVAVLAMWHLMPLDLSLDPSV